MGAVSVAVVSKRDLDLGQEIVADLTMSSSYANPGGDTVNAGDFGFRVGSELRSIQFNAAAAHVFEFAPDSTLADRGAVKAYTDVGTEVANGVDLSAVSARVVAFGR